MIMREIGGGKLVIIIDQAHLLSKRAFDSPRDRMERTPPNVTFILCTTEIDGVPESARPLFRQLEIGSVGSLYLGGIRGGGHWLAPGANRGAELTLPAKLRDLRHGGGQFDLSVR